MQTTLRNPDADRVLKGAEPASLEVLGGYGAWDRLRYSIMTKPVAKCDLVHAVDAMYGLP